jgi:hypothetical protein
MKFFHKEIFCGETPTTEKLKECSYWAQKDLMSLYNIVSTLYEHKHPLPLNITSDDLMRIGFHFEYSAHFPKEMFF